jgi:SAM-dependent methyltransferase
VRKKAHTSSHELKFLRRVGKTYSIGTPQNKVIRGMITQTFLPHLTSKMRGLQLGYFDGVDTGLISDVVGKLDVIEGYKPFIHKGLKEKRKNVKFVHTLFEEYDVRSNEVYDCVFAIYVLEHVFDPKKIFKMVKNVLKPGGKFFVVVPNARALSRQLALHMGLIEDLKMLTENDKKHGHRRVYDRVSLNRDVEENGFKTIHQGGVMLKILADFQLDELIKLKVLREEHFNGLYKLGLEYPDLCGSLFSICQVASNSK